MRKVLLFTLLALIAGTALAGNNGTKPVVVPPWADTAVPTTDILTPTNGFIAAGWLNSATPPSRQKFNWVLNFATNGVRYLTSRGIPDWDAAETYSDGAVVQYLDVLYQSPGAGNVNHTPGSTSTFWQSLATKTPPNGDNSLAVATTAFAHNNYIPIGGAFSLLGGQIAAAQVPQVAVTQYQSALSINYGQLVGVPSSNGAVANSLCLRDPNGDIFTRYINAGSPNNEGGPYAQLVYTLGTDGYLRKGALTSVETQMNLAAIGGIVTPGQVPQAAVTQFSPQIFNFNASQSQANPGFTTIPGGVVIEWGTVSLGDVVNPVTGTVTFPKPFHSVFNITVSANDNSNGGATTVIVGSGNFSTTQFIWSAREFVTAVQSETLFWTAIGN